MATTIASQLQVIKSLTQVESEPSNKPFTRPSILFDPREAADIGIDTLYKIALSGLEALVSVDEHFKNYKNDLFSHKSMELDREMMGVEENKRINASIRSYLTLLSGHLQLHYALKTLEYLIRRYKIHVYNVDDLILCALPYHDTHTFVKIVQLLNIRNGRWMFLMGIKASGAPPPRSVIVQQCNSDKGVLEELCNYASSSRKFQPSRPVLCFFTAVVMEVLGSTAKIENDIVRRILPYIDSSLQSSKASSDHKASALMLTVLLANKATLSPKLVNGLLKSVSDVARGFAMQFKDLELLQVSFLALVNIVQSQPVHIFPEKALESLKEIQDFTGILIDLFKSFNIEKFILIFLHSLVLISSGDDWYLETTLSIIKNIPMKGLLNHTVFKVLHHIMRLYQKMGNSAFHGTGAIRSQKILAAINKYYRSEFDEAIQKAIEDPKFGRKEDLSEIFGKLLDLSPEASSMSHSKPLLEAEHPKTLDHPGISSVNIDTICSLSESLLVDNVEHFPLLSDLSNKFKQSTTPILLVLLQSFSVKETCIGGKIIMLIKASFPVLKSLFTEYEASGKIPMEKFFPRRLDRDCGWYLDHLRGANIDELNLEILISLFWKVSESLLFTGPSLDCNEVWECLFRDVLFFFMTCRGNHIFKNHLHFIISECRVPPLSILLKFFIEKGVPVNIQIESLRCFSYLCSYNEGGLASQLLHAFPSLLVPLFGDNQDVRVVAMDCIEGVHTMCLSDKISGLEYELVSVWNRFLKDLLGLIIEHKRFMVSDRTYISEFFSSLLSPACDSFVAPRDLDRRYTPSEKEDILSFILSSALKLSEYGKLRILSILRSLGSKLMGIRDVQSLFCTLMEKQQQNHTDSNLMSTTEIEILCILLEISTGLSSFEEFKVTDYILKVLQVEKSVNYNPTLMQPCLTVLNKICNQFYNGLETNMQDVLFKQLVILYHSDCGEIQNATKDALLRINVSSATLCNVLSLVTEHETINFDVKDKKKKKRTSKKNLEYHQHLVYPGEIEPSFVSSFLDILVLRKNMEGERYFLVKPLFKLFGKTLDEKWADWFFSECQEKTSAEIILCQIQQTTLYILQEIVASLAVDGHDTDGTINEFDIELLVGFAQSTMDAVTRNHVFSLLSAIARVRREKVLGHTVNIISVIGASTLERFDTQSQSVSEGLISALVPFWLAGKNKIENILQVFTDILPTAASHKRASIITYLIKILGSSCSLGPFIFLLFQSLASRKGLLFLSSEQGFDLQCIFREWEYEFAMEISGQFSFLIWLPSLVKHLQKVLIDNQMFWVFLLSMRFILKKLHDPEFSFQVESCESTDDVQKVVGELMDLVVTRSFLFGSKKKSGNIPRVIRREVGDCVHQLLRTIRHVMLPASYFRSLTKSLVQGDRNIVEKALGILCEGLQEHEPVEKKKKKKKKKHSKKRVNSWPAAWLKLDEDAQESFENMCLEITKIVDAGSADAASLTAVSSLELLCLKFPQNHTVLKSCLSSVVANVRSGPLATRCLRAAGALVGALGPAALSDLPCLMRVVIDAYSNPGSGRNSSEKSILGGHMWGESHALAVLLLLESAVDSLGSFLSPYVSDIVKILVLNPSFTSVSDVKLKAKADSVRRVLADKVPVRHLLSPILRVCEEAVDFGDVSMSLVFEMLVRVVVVMDKAAVAENHCRIFEVCLAALDIRSRRPASILGVDSAEVGVTDAMVGLTLKLREAQFKPLFFKSVEWAEAADCGVEEAERMRVCRGISFYGLVHRLVESHRILFVPYFKHLVEASVSHLTCGGEETTGPIRKRKKSKIRAAGDAPAAGNGPLSPERWHLRYVVLSSLHKCFVYDAGHLKFLDSANFQLLVKPIVSQLSVEPPPPASLGGDGLPSVDEVDGLLVSCIGQMAVTCGNDLLWKSLNHEVLMQTRSEGVRGRMVGLRAVKKMVEKLKEEYVVLVAETIPFLAELLEDVEIPVRTLAQHVIKDMESITGENLKDYL